MEVCTGKSDMISCAIEPQPAAEAAFDVWPRMTEMA
jgi:hypothetical protein